MPSSLYIRRKNCNSVSFPRAFGNSRSKYPSTRLTWHFLVALVLRRHGLLRKKEVDALSRLCFTVCFPALLFASIYETKLNSELWLDPCTSFAFHAAYVFLARVVVLALGSCVATSTPPRATRLPARVAWTFTVQTFSWSRAARRWRMAKMALTHPPPRGVVARTPSSPKRW